MAGWSGWPESWRREGGITSGKPNMDADQGKDVVELLNPSYDNAGDAEVPSSV